MNVVETPEIFILYSYLIYYNYPPEMARYLTLFGNPKWFQLFVYFFSKKKIFLRKTTPTHFKFSWMCQGHFCHFWKFLLVNLKPVFLQCLGTHRIHQGAERVDFSTQDGLTRLVLWFKQKKVQKNMCEKYVRCGLKMPLLTILDQHFVLWWADD